MQVKKYITSYIETVSNWEASESPTTHLCFMAPNDKKILVGIVDAFIEMYDISIKNVGHYAEVTITRGR